VLAFEPMESCCQALRHNAALNRFSQIQVFPLALGDHEGQETFRVSSSPAFGSLASTAVHVALYAHDQLVKVASLDRLIEQKKLPPPDWIKIDVEGAELQVLQGARNTVAQYRPLLAIELHGTNQEIARHLQEIGYIGFVAISPGTDVLSAHWNANILAIPQEKHEILESLRGST
jgi:FkbM family methyltransferase